MKRDQQDKNDFKITLARWFIGVLLAIAGAKIVGEVGIWIGILFILFTGFAQIHYQDKRPIKK